MAIEVGVLGPLRVTEGGRDLAPGGPKERALLAALALSPGVPTNTERLIDALWGEEPPPSAPKLLQNAVLRLRRSLGTESIRTTPGGYALGDAVAVDTSRFESSWREARAAVARGSPRDAVVGFRESLGMWRGSPFTELDGWEPATAEATRLSELRRLVEEDEIDARLASGEDATCIADVERLVADEPLREHRWAELMLALYRSGRQADALRAYQRARSALVTELGVEPGLELVALERDVLAHDPAIAAHPPDTAQASPLPTGVVTFLMTDVEGSTHLWEHEPDTMPDAIALHDHIVATVVANTGGTLLKSRGEGDSTLSVFVRATDAVDAAAGLRARLEEAVWPGSPITVRCAVHTGEAVERNGDYYGPTLNRAARVRALAAGGQILASQATAEVVRDHLPPGCDLVELGPFALRDLERPERVFALVEPGRPGRDVVGGMCPYPGLAAFEPEDHSRYFGREELVATLLGRLADTGHLAVVGASGSGKSSLVRAGIVGSLREDRVALMTPGAHPCRELARCRAVAGDGRFVLVVDQLEEAFVVCVDGGERRSFLDELVEIGSAGSDVSAVVVALRGDYYGHCAEHGEFASMVASGTVLLGAMRPDELRVAIEGPARQAGLRLEPGLAEAVLGDVAGAPGALPLLSHAMRETWRRRQGNLLTTIGYRRAGGVRGAIARTADTIYDSLTAEQRGVMRAIFLRLVEPGEDQLDTRRRASLRELVGVDRDPHVTEVLERLVDARLVTVSGDGVEVAHEALIREWPRLRSWLDDDRDGLRLVRALASAASEWDSLDRDPGALYRGVRLAAVLEWQHRASSMTLNRLEREFVDASHAAQEAEADAADTRLREQTRVNRNLRRMLVGTAIALVLALGAGVLAFVQRNRADDSAARARTATAQAVEARLVAQSHALLTQDPQLGALLAVSANRLHSDAATRGALLDAVVADPRLRGTLIGRTHPYELATYTPDGTKIVVRARRALEIFDVRTHRALGAPLRVSTNKESTGVAVSPDGALVAAGGSDHRLRFWDLRTGRPNGPAIRASGPLLGVAFSPDGRILATAAGVYGDTRSVPTDRTVQLWDASTRRLLPIPLTGHASSVNVVAFSPDGRVLATGGNDGRVVLHDPVTGAMTRVLDVGNFPVFSLAFSPDGTRLVTGGQSSKVTVFDVRTGAHVGSPLEGRGVLQAVGYSADGTRILTSGTATILWDAATLTKIGDPLPSGRQTTGVAFAPRGRTFAVVGYGGIVTLWDPDAPPLVSRSIPEAPAFGGVFSPDGSVVAAPDTGQVTLYDTRTLRSATAPLRGTFGVDAGVWPPPSVLAFSRGGSRLVVAGLLGDVAVFDVTTGRSLGPPISIRKTLVSLALSPDGATIAAGGDGGLWLIDTASGKTRGPFQELAQWVTGLSFSPDGHRLVAANSVSDAIVLDHLDRPTPRVRPLPDARGRVIDVAFSPDGTRLVAAGPDGTVQLRDGKTLQPLGPGVPIGRGFVTALTYSPDGRVVAVTDVSPALHLVDAGSLQPIGPALPVGIAAPASFSADGRMLARSVPGGTELMRLDVRRWRTAACRIAGRNLTAAELHAYLAAARPVVACPGNPTPAP